MKKPDAYTVDTVAALGDIIDEAERMKHSYFWRPPTNAGGRRNYEKLHSHPGITWTENGHEFGARYDVTCSCQNIYASGAYSRDGKTTNLTAVRNSYKRMMAALFPEKEA